MVELRLISQKMPVCLKGIIAAFQHVYTFSYFKAESVDCVRLVRLYLSKIPCEDGRCHFDTFLNASKWEHACKWHTWSYGVTTEPTGAHNCNMG